MLHGGQTMAARFVLLRKLGTGHATEVWQARDREGGTDRVLKVLVSDAPAARAAFLAATRRQQQFDHPNLQACASVHDGDPAFAVFPRVASADASTLRGRPWQQLLPVLVGVADGLAALHARGIVHRDLKPANVLLDEVGTPMLADFGIAASVDDAAAPRGGSPFSTSPQQLDGLSPSPADDVYGFGALAYELLSGYPPFYPDPRPQRVRNEAPAPLPERIGVDPALERLVLRCLAKHPDDRPADGAVLAAELHGIAAGTPAVAGVAPSRQRLAPPAAPDGGIDPQWTRTERSTPSARQLQSQGFRRGLVAASLGFLLLAAGFVFFVLPRTVESPPAAPTAANTAAAPAPAPEESPDLERLAEARRAFEELRPTVTNRLEALEQRGAGAWAGEEFARSKQTLADADAAFGRREFEAALESLRAVDGVLEATGQRAQEVLRASLAAGARALDDGDVAAARSAFQRALTIEPGNATAQRGLERAQALPEVLRLLAEARTLEDRGEVAGAAAAYRKALQLDRDARGARAALARLEARATGDAFAAAVSQGLEALTGRDYASARSAFERAGRLRPGAAEVADGLAQVERGLAETSITGHLAAARDAEQAERWSRALVEYRKALDVDRNLVAAREGIERAEPRAMLDAELAAVIERPERLFSAEVRGAARRTLQAARSVPAPGPVLTRQVATVEDLLAAAETPLRVTLASDNLTDVTIYRVGRLGTFERKDVELLPGRYTVVGVRAGYRDVRREIMLVPGKQVPDVVIRCEEPI